MIIGPPKILNRFSDLFLKKQMPQGGVLFFLFIQALRRDFFFENWNNVFLKVVLVSFFPQISILSGESMNKESICTPNSLNFITEKTTTT